MLVFELLQNTDGEEIEVEICQNEENQNHLVNRWSTQCILFGETFQAKDSIHATPDRDNPHIPVNQDVDLQGDLFSSRNSCGGTPAGIALLNALMQWTS